LSIFIASVQSSGSLEDDRNDLKDFLNGDENGFVELVRRYKSGVYRVVISIVKDKRTAEEATEDTFMKLYNKAHTFKHRSSFKTWLYTIAANTAKNYLKKLKRRNGVLSLDEDIFTVNTPNDPIKRTEVRATLEMLERIVDGLPGRQREVFRMKYMADLSIREIAETLELSEGSVKASLSFALAKVREEMTPYL